MAAFTNQLSAPQASVAPDGMTPQGPPLEAQENPAEEEVEAPGTEAKELSPADRNKLLAETTENLRRMRNFRRQYDTRRSYFYRQYLGQRDAQRYPDNLTPRSNTFLMYPWSNVETVVSRSMDAFFSSPDYLECRGRGANDEDAAEKMEMVLQYQNKHAKLIPKFEELVRNICIYGHAGWKVDWDWDYDLVYYKEPVPAIDPSTQQPLIDPQTQQPVILGYKRATKKVPRNRPKFIPIDVYDLYIDPDGDMVAHLTERTLGQLKREAENYLTSRPDEGELYYKESLDTLEQRIKEGSPDGGADDVIIRIAEFWNVNTCTVTILTFGEDAKESIGWKDLRAAYRAANYSPYRRKLYTGENILLWSGPFPFAHKRAPIVYSNYVKLPNEVYGIGVIEPISDLTEALNRFANMIVDNWNLGINRRFAYDVTADIDHEALNNANVPGGKVAVYGDPSKVLYPLPVNTPGAGDYQLLEVYKGMIEMTSGISDFYSKGVGGSAGNKTATGINQIIGETNYKFRLFIRNLEVDILEPTFQMCAAMNIQFLPDYYEVAITGDAPGIPKYLAVTPDELVGTFMFDLVGANYAVGRTVLQRNFMALANVIGASPFIDEYRGMQEMLKAFQLPKSLLKRPEQVQMEQQQQQMAQQEQIADERAFETKMALLQGAVRHESATRLAHTKASVAGRKEGRPPNMQFEGKVPGGNLEGMIRSLSQSMGAGGLGMEGMGQTPGSEQ